MKILRTLAATALLAPGLFAQNDHTTPTFEPEGVVLRHYRPRSTPTHELTAVAQHLYGREIIVRGVANSEPVENLFTLGDRVVVYDSPEYVARVLEGLKAMESEASGQQASRFEVFEYSPQYASLDEVVDALGPFIRSIYLSGSNGPLTQVNNISLQEERMSLVLRDTPEVIEDVKALLARIDVPAPQVMLSCWLLRADASGDPLDTPRELLDNLERMTGQSYALQSMGMLRTSVRGDSPIRLSMAGHGAERFELELLPVAYDPGRGALNFAHCRFASGFDGGTMREVFSTSATVYGDEYTVLGASGLNPTYVVLRIEGAE